VSYTPQLVIAAFLGILAAWCYWPTLQALFGRWSTDPQYSHGYLVPIFSCAYLWIRRPSLALNRLQPSWGGVVLLLIGLGLRFLGTYFFFDWLDMFSILPTVAGIAVLVSGWSTLKWAFPAIGFLIFMIPLPYRVEISLAHPLQRIATVASTYLMQTLGLPAVGEGNVILLHDSRIGVVEACSGLRMLVVFFALSTAFGLLAAKMQLWERLIIVASAVPIALASNIIRITVTGILHGTGHSELAERFFHDVAGWLMMPLALGFLALEMFILSNLFIEKKEHRHCPIDQSGHGAKRTAPNPKQDPLGSRSN
jgi:exosortase